MLTRLHLRGDHTERGCAVLFVLAMALTGVLLTEAPGAAESTVSERGRVSPQVYGADVGGVGTEMLGVARFTLQQATGTPTSTASPTPSPTPSPSPTPTPAVAPGDEDDLPSTGAGVLVLGTIGTWTLFLGMFLLHIATRRAERLRSLDGYL